MNTTLYIPLLSCAYSLGPYSGGHDRPFRILKKMILVTRSGDHMLKNEIATQPWVISNLHKILIYLHIIHLLKSSTCFEHYPNHLQEVYVVIVYMQPLVSSLSAGDCLVHRLRMSSFLTDAQDSHLQGVTIPDAAYIQLQRRPPEDEQGNARNI